MKDKDQMTTDKVTITMTAQQAALINQAAAIRGETIEDFLVHAALEKAAELLDFGSIKLSPEGWLTVEELLANPPEPNAALLAAMRRHRELISRDTDGNKGGCH